MPFYEEALITFQCWNPGENPYGYRELSWEQSPGLFQHPELWLADFPKLQNHDNFMARLPFLKSWISRSEMGFPTSNLRNCLRASVCMLSPESPARREKTHLWIFHPNIAGMNRHYRALPITIPTGGRQDSGQPTARGWQATSPLGFSFLPLRAKRERSSLFRTMALAPRA